MWDKTPAWMFWLAIILLFGIYVWNQTTIQSVEQRAIDYRIQVYDANLKACNRVNVLRDRINELAEALNVDEFERLTYIDCEDVFPLPRGL